MAHVSINLHFNVSDSDAKKMQRMCFFEMSQRLIALLTSAQDNDDSLLSFGETKVLWDEERNNDHSPATTEGISS